MNNEQAKELGRVAEMLVDEGAALVTFDPVSERWTVEQLEEVET